MIPPFGESPVLLAAVASVASMSEMSHAMRAGEDQVRLWRVSLRALYTPALALLLVVTIVGALEILARSDAMPDGLPPPSYDTPSRLFDVQMLRMNQLATRIGVDCVFLGSSPVQDGFDPAVFGEELERLTGTRPSCFNLAVPGMRAASTGMLGRVVLDDIDPQLIVYGFSPRDFSRSAHGPSLHHSDWLRHRGGQWAARGWAIDRSNFYRTFLGSRTAFQRREGVKWLSVGALHEDGFFSRYGRVADPERVVAEARAKGSLDETADEEAFAALHALVRQPRAAGRIVIVRMPFHPLVEPWLDELESYLRASSQVEAIAEEFGAPVLRPPNSIVGVEWADPMHVNYAGAAELTKWLAAAVVDLVEQRRLGPLVRN